MTPNGLHERFARVVVLSLALVLPGQAFAESSSGTACEQSGGVAIVNMETVARALGRDATMEQQIDTRTQELKDQLQQVAKEIGEKLEAEVANTPDQRTQLQQLAEVAFQQQQQQAQQVLAQFRVKLATDFRNEVGAVARTIAEERGYSVVFVEQVAVYFKDSRDITDEVTGAMGGAAVRATGDAASAPVSAAGARPGGG